MSGQLKTKPHRTRHGRKERKPGELHILQRKKSKFDRKDYTQKQINPLYIVTITPPPQPPSPPLLKEIAKKCW